MAEPTQNLRYYMRYQDIVKVRNRAYYAKNKDKINEKKREKYKQMTPNERKNLVIKQKEWYERQYEEKKDEMRQTKKRLSKI